MNGELLESIRSRSRRGEEQALRLVGRHVRVIYRSFKCQVILDNWNSHKWAYFAKLTHNLPNRSKLKGDWVFIRPNQIIKIESS